MELKKQILHFIAQQQRPVTFAELRNAFGDSFDGQKEMGVFNLNWILWQNMSAEFVAALTELRDSRELTMAPIHAMFYECPLNLPLATHPRAYTAPHWVPTAWQLTRQ